MEMEFLNGQTDEYMLGNMLTIKNKDLGNLHGLMEINIKDNGKMAISMGKATFISQMANENKDNTIMGKK